MGGLSAVLRKYYAAHQKELALAATLFLVAAASFGLGFEAYRRLFTVPIVIAQCAPQDRASAAPLGR